MRRLLDWLGTMWRGEPSHVQLQREFSMLRLEWAEVLDKLQHWSSRQAKRDSRALSQGLGTSSEENQTELALPSDHKSELRRRAFALRGGNKGSQA